MSDNIKELVKRLRDRREYQSRGHGEVVDVADGDCEEAADALEAMVKYRADYEAMKAHNKELFGKLSAAEAERDKWQGKSNEQEDRADLLTAERDRLKAALVQLKMHIGPGYEYAVLFEIINKALEGGAS